MKEGWKIKKLGDLFNIQSGKRVYKKDWRKEGVPFYRAREVVKLAKDGYVENELFISEELYNQFTSEKGKPKEGDIIISAVGTLGQCYLVKENDKFYIKDASVLWFEKKSSVDSKYIEYSFKAPFIKEQVLDRSMGATVGTLTITRAKNINIPLPPLPEQHRIVSILDHCFEAIDKAKANAEQNLQNAKELFESYLQGVFEKKGEGWEEKRLGTVCIVERGSSPRPIKKYQTESSDGVNWIKIGDTKGVDKYIYTTKEKITKEGAKKSRYVKKGDFILSNSMSFGKPYIMKTDGYIHDGWFVLRLPDYLNKDYFYNLLISPNVQKQIHSLAAGAIVKNISGDLVKKVDISFPPTPKQEYIVRKLDSLYIETQKLEVHYQNKIDDLEELKKSILQKAFAGELKTEKMVKEMEEVEL